ncbi:MULTISPECIES: surface protein [Streptomyces]|uniref:Surface protein n=1 Tax=Streptomyces venezuelae TaxID=54571 RepID=A0A5P2B4B3_STRVZ|nr:MULTISPECIES: surface protein [Streptomyces]NEA00987.1 surface protein [Streptomyces sp. SID10116]MYY84844.1 surface protein [Streptomyces sp. SID335]MYZ14137.1 surface protein [Streptomyces sp. SID337]NDZ87035.1 surface protein [Streptomyces sp. SID10115]NEB46991.1 surface protein [Streptomyces sp. SID339]
MHDTEQEDPGPPGPATALALPPAPYATPPLRLAGIDEDDTFESHLVRGID